MRGSQRAAFQLSYHSSLITHQNLSTPDEALPLPRDFSAAHLGAPGVGGRVVSRVRGGRRGGGRHFDRFYSFDCGGGPCAELFEDGAERLRLVVEDYEHVARPLSSKLLPERLRLREHDRALAQ